MTGATDRLLVAFVALGVAAVLAWVLAARTRRRAASAIVATPQAARIIAFHAHWCAACVAQRRQLDALDDVEVRHVDVEQQPDAARRHGIRSLPTTIVVGAAGAVDAINHGLVAAATLRGQLDSGARAAAPADSSRVPTLPVTDT